MTGQDLAAGSTEGAAPALPPDLRLRADRPRVVRLSRTVVWSLGGVCMVAVAFALGYALQDSHRAPSPPAAQDTDVRPSADGLAGLPSDYVGSGVPKLGQPLPGDLGRPILNAQRQGRVGPVPGMGDRRGEQEIEAARTSRLFAQIEAREEQGAQAVPVMTTTSGVQASPTGTDQQTGNRAFLAGLPDRATVSPDRITPPASPYVLQTGTVIAGALNTKISSGLPGQIVGHVTQNVYDSPTGRYLLIPQGSTLFGAYNSSVSFGQQRTQIIWNRLIYPNGESLMLEKLPGGDAIGQSGLSDEVNNHWGQLFRAALVTTLLSVGSEAGTSWNENNLMQAIRSGTSNGFSMVGNRLIDRSLNVQPTLTDRPGLPFTLILNRDLVLKPWKEKETYP
ncbi:conjugal transfer protein TrbI [Gluconacetobacter liquefaciens]|uniref:TrbI/VirB10 family protein n=1 Tax=Gluconacetobacter liquefaciens TaxID=89584 RepID=A0A370FVA6_GLULI|nr:TrbI/VirB10 family protein [Gluconacetobacter liquefaciens]MBB2187858.1 TrbI/VirB10 family protein [Gluconacetobacter liquefaciens]RDI32747.1 type IV secretion system protein VirB10 [Gluconacetobacter liquefaciens]GBR12504.1 conjugal transfer protein TrbI [Gluconacetobacter liquefaciens NRIC 0522]GEB39236.1 conjugal transfer protein TrbI [Gluconacetobacter liquefaciens]